MSLYNQRKDMTPFDMERKPMKQIPLLMPLIWGISYVMTRKFGLKIEKVGMEKLKPPYLVMATHQGFSDYYIAPLALFPHRAIYVSDMEGFAAFGKGLYRGCGCVGKRRYVPQLSVMFHIKNALKKRQIVVLYPESRHSNIGITGQIPENMGRLVKTFNVPLVILSAKGSYLANPFWNEEKTRKVPIQAKAECILRKDQIMDMDEVSIQQLIKSKLQYDEYQYQHEKGFLISDEDRAEGMELALYQCIACNDKYKMTTEKSILKCTSCKREYRLSENGWLIPLNDLDNDSEAEPIHPPRWYRWQEKEVKSLREFNKKFTVNVEALPNEKGFVNLEKGELLLDEEGFTLVCKNVQGENQKFRFPYRAYESLQTEYNYRTKGKCIVLSTKACCYYIYCKDADFQPTELQFIAEHMHKLCSTRRN